MGIILGEAAVVTLAGGVLGWLLGMGTAAVLMPRLVSAETPVLWSGWLALYAVCGAVVVGLAASLYPAVKAARLDPTTALRAL